MAERRPPAARRVSAQIALLAVAAYLLRFAASWWLLHHVADDRFDPHAFGLLGDAILLSMLAPFSAGLLWWILRRRGVWRGLLASASRPGWTLLSILLLLLLGAPTPNQVWAAILLSPVEAWPAVLSATLWFATAAFLRVVAVTGPR